MLLFDSIVFGSFVGFLVDYWLGRFRVPELYRLIIAVVIGVVVTILVDNHRLLVF